MKYLSILILLLAESISSEEICPYKTETPLEELK